MRVPPNSRRKSEWSHASRASQHGVPLRGVSTSRPSSCWFGLNSDSRPIAQESDLSARVFDSRDAGRSTRRDCGVLPVGGPQDQGVGQSPVSDAGAQPVSEHARALEVTEGSYRGTAHTSIRVPGSDRGRQRVETIWSGEFVDRSDGMRQQVEGNRVYLQPCQPRQYGNGEHAPRPRLCQGVRRRLPDRKSVV